jgi:hypothetical protein
LFIALNNVLLHFAVVGVCSGRIYRKLAAVLCSMMPFFLFFIFF